MSDWNYRHEMEINQYLSFFIRMDSVLLNALISNGLPTDTDFIKENITRVQIEGDGFDHYWFHFDQPDAIRVVSIERSPEIKFDVHREGPIELINTKMEAKYY